MTKLLRDVIEKVETLPAPEQDAAAVALLDYLDHMRDLHLTDEQIAEVRQRLSNPGRELLSLADARQRLARS